MNRYIYRLSFKQDTNTNWENSTYIPLKGEPCFDITNNILKVGNGVDVFKDLHTVIGSCTDTSVLEDYVAKSEKGNPKGVAKLDENGVVPLTQLPANALSDYFEVDNSTDQENLEATTGDICYRTDTDEYFIYLSNKNGDITDWYSLKLPSIDFNTLSDVTITNPETDEVIAFDGSKWINKSISGESYNFLEVDYDANDGDTSVTVSDDTELDISSIRVDINGVKLRSNKYTVDKNDNTIVNLDDSLNENDWVSIEVIYK